MSRMLRAGSRISMRMASQRKLGVQVWCRCLWEYKAEYDDDLRIEPGDIIQVTDAEYDEGWWEGMNMRTGAQGIFPINHVEPCDGPGQQPAMEQGGRGGGGYNTYAGGSTLAGQNSASAATPNPMGGGGGVPGPPPKGATGMMAGGGGIPGPPPKGAKGMSGVGGGVPGPPPKGAKGMSGKGGRGGKGGGGGRAKAGANSKTRFGIYGTNVTIYGCMLWVVLGLAVLIWTGMGDPDQTTGEVRGRNPWLHECASAYEVCKCYWFGGYVLEGVSVPLGEKINHTKCPFESYAAGGVLTLGVDGSFPGVVKGSPTDKCLRNPSTMPKEGVAGFSRALCERPADIDVLPPVVIGLYCIFAGLGIGGYEFYTGFLRDGSFPKRTPLYMALTLPGYFTLPTIFGGIFIILGSALQIFGSVKFGEVYHYRRGMNEVRICQHMLITFRMGKYGSSCDRVATCIGGANPEGKFGRIMFGLVYVTLNLVLGTIWFSDAAQSSANARAISSNQMFDFTVWVPVAKFFGVIMNVNFTVIFIPVSRIFIKRLYNVSTGSQTSLARTVRAILLIFPLDYALEFHMLCGIIGYISAVLHTFAHVLNFATRAEQVWVKFGWWIWFTGIGLLVCLTILIAAVHRNVRRNYFNIFYYTHLMYIPITILNLFHGANYFGPNFWKFFIIFVLPTYVVEIGYRLYQGSVDVSLMEFTNMDKVTRLALGKESIPVYKEGMFAFINCPEVSEFEWHPFTISSAPEEPYITFHMRIQGKGSWTRGVKEYLEIISAGKVFTELYHHDPKQGRIRGMKLGPTGKPFFHLRGPCSAPTQHISEYDEVMICASGIGVTPLASCMKSIVFHKWKFFSGRCFPDRAHFFWVCSHRDLASFRWFVRTIKEAEDAVIDLTQKNADVGTKMFHMHIFVTSFKENNKDLRRPANDEDSQLAFWGKKRNIDDKADRIVDNIEGSGYNQVTQYGASFTEWDLYSAIMDPAEGTVSMGHVHVHKGRPAWDDFFKIIAEKSPAPDIGVTFCGNPLIGADLTKCADKYTALSGGMKTFHLHQEVF